MPMETGLIHCIAWSLQLCHKIPLGAGAMSFERNDDQSYFLSYADETWTQAFRSKRMATTVDQLPAYIMMKLLKYVLQLYVL